MRNTFILIVLIVIVGAAVFFFGIGKEGTEPLPPDSVMEKISYLVDESEGNFIKIVGSYWEGKNEKAVILLHMMPATRESWNQLGEKLNQRGFSVLAIDLRGHGESTEAQVNGAPTTLDYKAFNSEQHRLSKFDVEGARKWLSEKGIKPENIYVGGASIGANLAIEYLAGHPEAKRAFVLSPGLDYSGIRTEAALQQLSETQSIFLIAADDDDYAAESVRTLEGVGSSEKKVQVFEEGGHGTDIFSQSPDLLDDIVNWLEG